MICKIFFLIFFLFLPLSAYAEHLHLEKEYQAAWCTMGELEYVLDDQARVDCMTDEYAIEFDFGPKWAEAIGQALYYGIKTGKKPGVVLILEKESDQKFLKRLHTVTDKLDIKVWTMGPNDF